jgi:hypothetical protein
MTVLRNSLIAASLSSTALIAAISYLPAKAQANALQQLSRHSIGSIFDDKFTTSSPGSPNVIAGNTSFSQGRSNTVQLRVPIKTGLEFKKIQAILPQVKILETISKVYVFVSEFPRALAAYELGRKLQDKLGVTFELAYSDRHPDLDLAWMGSINGDVASAPKIVDPLRLNKSQKTLSKQTQLLPQAEILGTAKDLNDLSLQSPWIAEKKSTSNPKLVSALLSSPKAAAPSLKVRHSNLELRNLPPIPQSIQKLASAPKKINVQKNYDSSQQHNSNLDIASPLPKSLRDSLAEITSIRVALSNSRNVATSANLISSSLYPQPTVNISEKTSLPQVNGLIRPVAIQPTNLGNIPLVSPRYVVRNKELAYVYVKLRNSTQLASLRKVSNISRAHLRNGELVATVGMYSNSRVGNILQRSQIQNLSKAGFEFELVASESKAVRNVNA